MGIELRKPTAAKLAPALGRHRQPGLVALASAAQRAGGLSLFVAALSAGLPALAGKAHEHGVARLDLAVSPTGISLRLESALDNLVGFERAPRTTAERAAVAAALQKLAQAGELFRIDVAGACDAGQSTVETPAPWQDKAATSAPARAAEHADLDASYEFKCKAAPSAAFMETGLFAAFPRLKRLELQIVTPRGQRALVLRRGQERVLLNR